jgi:hypothetical protein
VGEVDEVDEQETEKGTDPDRRQPRSGEEGFEQRCQGRLGDDPDGDTRGRNPHLARGQIQLEFLSHLPGAFESTVAVDELGLCELPGPSECELDRDEKAVREDQQEAGDETETDHCEVHGTVR